MCEVSHVVVLWLAGIIWLCGAVATGELGIRLLGGVASRPDALTALGCALGVGVVLGATLFKRLANKNIDRIDTLHNPRLWEAYRLQFYVILVVFDGGSVALSDYFAKDDSSRLAIGSVDLTVCVALSLSLFVYIYRGYTDFGQARAIKSPLLLEEEDQIYERGDGSGKASLYSIA